MTKYTSYTPFWQSLLAWSAAMLLTGASLGFLAQPLSANERTQAHIRYADLDLSHPAGQETLERRIATAARKLCASHGSIAARPPLRARDACLSQARADVRRLVMLARKANGPASRVND